MRKRKATKLRKPLAPGTQMHIDRKKRARLIQGPLCQECGDMEWVPAGARAAEPCPACGRIEEDEPCE